MSQQDIFNAERRRIAEEYGLTLLGVRTWGELRGWERWGRNKQRIDERLEAARERGRPYRADEEEARERRRLKLELGIHTEKRHDELERDEWERRALGLLREELELVSVHDWDPARFQTVEPSMPERDRQYQEDLIRFRQDAETKVDSKKALAEMGREELSETDQELIDSLDQLREAEREARERRELERDDLDPF
ncbi:hypothetical protein BH24ACT19_BH24ACT19_12060 [soil metagenome]